MFIEGSSATVPDESWAELVAVPMAMHAVGFDLVVAMELAEPTLGSEPPCMMDAWTQGLIGHIKDCDEKQMLQILVAHAQQPSTNVSITETLHAMPFEGFGCNQELFLRPIATCLWWLPNTM
eukprot:3390239-Amphidinium_carterae.1